MYAGSVDDLLVPRIPLTEDQFGWTTFDAAVLKQILRTVNIAAGEDTTARTDTTSPSHA